MHQWETRMLLRHYLERGVSKAELSRRFGAASHCVRSTVDELLAEMEDRGAPAGKLHVLADCMSAVAVPNPENSGEFVADFTPEVEASMRRWR